MITKIYETWCLDEATDLMKAAKRLGLEYDFEKINKPLTGLAPVVGLYTHQEHAFRVTVVMKEASNGRTE